MGNYDREEYHESYASWRNTRGIVGPLIGIELEVEDKDSYENVLAAIPDTDKDEDRPLVEDDGSLGSYTGVEIIFPPANPRTLMRSGSFFRNTLAALSELSLQDSNHTGMHINVNIHGWEIRAVRLFIALFHYLPKDTLENIGGRTLNGYCSQWRIRDFSDYQYSDEHSYAAEWKYGADRVELRFPKSTTDYRRVQTLLTFIGVASKWAEQSDLPTHYGTVSDARLAINDSFDAYLNGLRNTAAIRKMKEVMENGYT